MPRLFDLPIRFASRWIFNCYVVEDGGDGAALVVDAGLPSTAALALEELSASEERGTAAAAEPVVIASSHGHSDHVSGIPRLLAARSGKVWLPARCEAYLAGEAPRSPGPREVAKILPVFADQPFDWRALGEFVGSDSNIGYGRLPRMRVPFAVDGYLHDGEALSGASDWEILAAPGHSDDSTCFYHRGSATLISGDAILTHSGKAWFNPEVVDRSASRATEERLRELDVRHLLPGHGRPLSGRHLLRDARSYAEQPHQDDWLSALARTLGRWSP